VLYSWTPSDEFSEGAEKARDEKRIEKGKDRRPVGE
jgi:hypothetical protein